MLPTITIKVSSCCSTWDWNRQTPNSDGVWGLYRFCCNTDIGVCDYWIVYENLVEPQIAYCPPQNTIFITGEPPTSKKYHPKFLQQFGTIITCHTHIKHPHTIVSHLSLPWMVGYNPMSTCFMKSYSKLVSMPRAYKNKLISVICSKKTFTKGHKKRVRFVEKLKKYFGDKIDIYGNMGTSIPDKWDAIAPYKYHIAIENSAVDHYWTEKIADAYLAQSYPIYYGAPNIESYFSKDSFTKIDINKPQLAFKIIEELIENNTYEESINSLKQAKDLVLNKYNFFPRMTELCTKTDAKKQKITLQPHEYFYKDDHVVKKAIRKIRKILYKSRSS